MGKVKFFQPPDTCICTGIRKYLPGGVDIYAPPTPPPPGQLGLIAHFCQYFYIYERDISYCSFPECQRKPRWEQEHFRILIFSNSFGVLVILTAFWSVYQKDIKRKNKAGGSILSDDKGKILLL